MLTGFQLFDTILQVLVERFKDEIVASDILNNQDGLQGLLLRHFQEADLEQTGLLSQATMKTILKDLSYQVRVARGSA